MPERYARIAALALVVILIIAFPLLIALFAARQSASPAPTPTGTPTPQFTATATAVPATNTLLPSSTTTPTLVPSPTPTTGCPSPATPEPLWVDPVLSPTDLLTQNVSVTLGRGREISIASEAGTVTQEGDFSIARPVVLPVPLSPNTTNNLLVTGKVEYAPGCFYTLQTRTDRNGNPLAIVQQSATPGPIVTILPPAVITPTPFIIVTPPPPGTIFLKPFSQVFALNQDTPNATQNTFLYEGSPDAPFQILSQQGAFSHVQSHDTTLNFWTLNDNLAATPAPAPRYDSSVGGRTVELIPGSIVACEGQYPNSLLLGACAAFQDVGAAQAVVRADVDSSQLYLVEFNGKRYWVSSNVLANQPP